MSSFDTLVMTLEDEIRLYRQLYRSLQSEHELLVTLSMDELKKNNKEREKLMAMAGSLKDARNAVVSDMASYFECDMKDISLTDLISHADDRHRGQLEECRSVLRSLVPAVLEINGKNMSLIDSSVQHTNNSIEFLRDMMAPVHTYEETGHIRKDKSNGRIISKVG
ncbi:MAG: flagellar protein FlgN [Deltaproteobacteria bacterium]|nr:flagellar protein FlgN [Deltaproteobacteria bacterium]